MIQNVTKLVRNDWQFLINKTKCNETWMTYSWFWSCWLSCGVPIWAIIRCIEETENAKKNWMKISKKTIILSCFCIQNSIDKSIIKVPKTRFKLKLNSPLKILIVNTRMIAPYVREADVI